jgi:hypothetical protein
MSSTDSTSPSASAEHEVAHTIREWCESKRICLATYYKLRRLGLTPDELHVPGTNIRRITPEADRAWIARMAELTKTKEYEREVKRRAVMAKKAGDKAARSPKHVSQTHKAGIAGRRKTAASNETKSGPPG